MIPESTRVPGHELEQGTEEAFPFTVPYTHQ